jgi:hypothetical protein
LQVAVYPGAFDTHTRTELIKNVERIVFPQIVDALTKAIKPVEKRLKAVSGRATVFTGTFDEVNRYFWDMNWSDGMTIIPPTIERVVEFLKYTDYYPSDEIAILPIANLRATPWNIAVNGVMAGCRPEYMPLLIAYVRAIGDPQQGPEMAFGSTHSWTPYIWVNGPIARQLNLDHGQGLISHLPNRVIGRAVGLIVRNLVGVRIKETAMGTYGYPVPWVLAENEELLHEIGWEPYHVEKGFDRNTSTVTGSTATMWGHNNIPALSASDATATSVMQIIAREMSHKEVFGSGVIGWSQRTELISPPVAKVLAADYKTKQSLIEDLIKNSRIPTFEAAFSQIYGSPGHVKGTFEETLKDLLASPDAEKGKLPPWYGRFPGWEEIETIPCITEGKTVLLVCGDPSRNKTQALPGARGVSIREVELPKNWDKLMADLGYPALKDCFIQ